MKRSTTQVAMAVAALLISSSVIAAASKEVRDYSAQVKQQVESFNKLAKEAKGKGALVEGHTQFIGMVKALADQGMNLSSKDQSRIAQAIADGKTGVVSALYASAAAKPMVQAGKSEVEQADEGIMNIVKMAAVSGKGKASNLTADEMSDAAAALRKKTEYSVDMLSWSKEDAKDHVDVMNQAAKIYENANPRITSEEALVQAIMEVKGVDKDGAMKIVRKLRDCV